MFVLCVLSYFFMEVIMRKFEKVDREVFERDIPNGNYDEQKLPIRSTKNSAGYDFFSPISFELKVGESKVIPTGIRVIMNEDEFLGIYIRSSLGFKYNIRMCNQVGIIDADYYNNIENAGNIFVKIKNEGTADVSFDIGDRIVQGIFTKYLITDDDNTSSERLGGIGSTGEGDDNNG